MVSARKLLKIWYNGGMEIATFLEIGIVGIGLSLIIQFIKAKFGTESLTTKGLTVGLAVAAGTVWVLFSGAAWFATVLGILAAASTFYAFFLK